MAVGRQVGPLHLAVERDHHDRAQIVELSHGQNCGHRVVRITGDQVDQGATAGGTTTHGQLVDLQPVHPALAREDQDVGVGRCDPDILDEVLLLGGHAPQTLAAPVLAAVLGQVRTFHVAVVGQDDRHVLLGDQVLEVDVGGGVQDRGAAFVAELVDHLAQLALDQIHQQDVAGQQLQEPLDGRAGLGVLLADLVPLQAGEPLQPHVQHGLGLDLGEAELLDQAIAGHLAVGALANGRDHLVQVVQGDDEALEEVGPGPRLSQLELAAASDHLAAVDDELMQGLPEGQHTRLPVDDGQVDHPEGALQGGLLEQVVEHDQPVGVPLELDHDPHPAPVRFVTQIADPFHVLGLDQIGDVLDQPRLVHLVGDLGDDDRLLVALLVGLDLGLAAHDDPAAPRGVGLPHAVPAVDGPGGGEIRRRDVVHQLQVGQLGVVDQGGHATDHLHQVVGRDLGRHPHRDAVAAVDQQVGEGGGQDDGFGRGAVEVLDEVDRVLVDVPQHLLGDLGQPALRVAVCRRGVTVHRAEVALAVHQRVAQVPRLGHPHQRVVDRLVPVGVVLLEHLTDHTGALAVAAAAQQSLAEHGVQDAAVHRLEPVARVGERAADDHAHRVVEIRRTHLVLDVHVEQVSGYVVHGSVVSGVPREADCGMQRRKSKKNRVSGQEKTGLNLSK